MRSYQASTDPGIAPGAGDGRDIHVVPGWSSPGSSPRGRTRRRRSGRRGAAAPLRPGRDDDQPGVPVAAIPGPGPPDRVRPRMRGLGPAGRRPSAPAPGLVAGQPRLPSNRSWRGPVAGPRAEATESITRREDRDERWRTSHRCKGSPGMSASGPGLSPPVSGDIRSMAWIEVPAAVLAHRPGGLRGPEPRPRVGIPRHHSRFDPDLRAPRGGPGLAGRAGRTRRLPDGGRSHPTRRHGAAPDPVGDRGGVRVRGRVPATGRGPSPRLRAGASPPLVMGHGWAFYQATESPCTTSRTSNARGRARGGEVSPCPDLSGPAMVVLSTKENGRCSNKK